MFLRGKPTEVLMSLELFFLHVASVPPTAILCPLLSIRNQYVGLCSRGGILSVSPVTEAL